MSRPRTFSTEAVVTAARDAFWRLGYEGAAVSDLEQATGLSRSSLYQAFGSKEQLFRAALDLYIRTFVTDLLASMEQEGADERSIEGFFSSLHRLFSGDGLAASYGCLWVNSIVDLNRRVPPPADARSAEYWERLQGAFANALRGSAPDGGLALDDRARTLAGATFGCWLVGRIDSRDARMLSLSLAAAVASWRRRH